MEAHIEGHVSVSRYVQTLPGEVGADPHSRSCLNDVIVCLELLLVCLI
jgi:hypothetical protein